MSAVKVMSDPLQDFADVPLHANVMAIIKVLDQPVSWALLVEVVERLQAGNSVRHMPLSMITPDRVEESLVDVVRDLRALKLVTVSTSGSELTPAADSTIESWNGKFKERLAEVSRALDGVLTPA